MYDSEGNFIKSATVKNEAFKVTQDTASISLTLRDSTETDTTCASLREKLTSEALSPALYAMS